MQKMSLAKIVACLTLGICAQIPATAQIADSTPDRGKLGPTVVPVPGDDQDFYAVPARPVLRRHLVLPSSAPAVPGQPRLKPKLRVATEVRPDAVKTGTGIVYTCASNVPTSTCNYLNTTVAGYYNNIFLNANANIYIQFGATGLGASEGFINLVHYAPYVTAMTNKAVKSSNQASALSSINTYATPAYGTQNIVGITVSLGTALGFTGLLGINATETASCTPFTSGCYNEVITVADAATQASEGFTLYYDDQGGTEGANQYDFYAVVQHETDEVLGTSSCISTQGGSGLSDECDGPVTGSNGIPSVVDLLRYSSPAHLALDTAPSTTAGQYYSFDGGVDYGVGGDGGKPKVYNTLANGDDFSDYISSSPDCGTNQAVQDAEGCPGEDGGLTILNDGVSEVTILNTDGFDIPEAAISSPAPGSTLSGTTATFSWSAVSGATNYWVYVGTTGLGSFNIFQNPAAITATSQAVTGLPTSGTIYVRVYSYVGGFWTSTDFTFTGGSGSSSPAITLTPTGLTFASTTVGSTTAAQAITVKNTGTATANLTSETLTGANASSYLISANTCGATLAASATCTVSVEFKPTTTGTLTASLSVADNATGSPQTASLTGTGTASSTFTVSLTPATLTFASTTVGATTAAQVVTIKNTGTGTVNLTSETLAGTSPGSYLISANTCGASLAASATCAVSIEFKPTTTGTLTASLSVADNATGSPQTASLTGTGAAASSFTVSLSPTSLAFPTTSVGQTSAAQTVTVTNTGSGTVNLTSETFSGTNTASFIVSTKTCGTTLAAGTSCTISVEFKPVPVGNLSANLSIADNATGSPQLVKLTGTSTAASSFAVSLTPSSLTFASTATGTTSAAQNITIKNTGTGVVNLTSETLAGANPTSYLISANTCGASLAAAATCVVSIEFKPTTTGSLTASLSVADNATGSPQSASLTGTGTASGTATLTFTPTSLAFPVTVVGTTSDALAVNIKNTGTGTVTLNSVVLGGTNPAAFEYLTGCGTSLAAGANCNLFVGFKPTVAGAASATITVTDNATGSPQVVALTGTGAGAPTVKLSATSLAFATTAHGTTSAVKSFSITNSGTAVLNIASISLTGANPTDFVELDNCPATLASNGICTVYVSFSPAAAAAYSAAITIVDNGSASPQTVTLTGTGN
jgi:Abnormal spindle-like microcephaly-assoc'd, ASPM-SPD-2-Hydin